MVRCLADRHDRGLGQSLLDLPLAKQCLSQRAVGIERDGVGAEEHAEYQRHKVRHTQCPHASRAASIALQGTGRMDVHALDSAGIFSLLTSNSHPPLYTS